MSPTRRSTTVSPVSPDWLLNLLAGGLIGLLLGVALAVSRELLDRTVRTADHIAEVTDAPVLASIGFDNDIRSSPLLTDLGGFAARTEAFRLLRTNLQFIDLDQRARVLVVTSAVPGEGKTMTSTNLAVALAQTGRTVLIIDADLRRPRVASTLGVDPAIGLTTALVGKTQIEDAIQVHEPSGLHVLASGAKPPNPTEILQSRVTHDLIRRLRQSYDMIIIDAPPLLPVADASVLSNSRRRLDPRRPTRPDDARPGHRGGQPRQPGRRPALRRRGQHGRQARDRQLLLLLLRRDVARSSRRQEQDVKGDGKAPRTPTRVR